MNNKSGDQKWLRQQWLEITAIACWGIVLIKYTLDGTLNILIHPNYFYLATSAGCALIGISLWQGQRLWREKSAPNSSEHTNLLPRGIGTWLLLATAVAGLLITPKLFASGTALQQGISESVPITRTQTKAFRSNIKPENRSLIDWIRTIDRYPEPDAYVGQKVKITGFAIHPPGLPKGYLLLGRFVITCCAADAYPIALAVKANTNVQNYPKDTWLEIKGQAIAEILNDRRQVVINAQEIVPISTPKNPYDS
jgi:uncharacterized repeat protein (TIGR03943 family)